MMGMAGRPAGGSAANAADALVVLLNLMEDAKARKEVRALIADAKAQADGDAALRAADKLAAEGAHAVQLAEIAAERQAVVAEKEAAHEATKAAEIAQAKAEQATRQVEASRAEVEMSRCAVDDARSAAEARNAEAEVALAEAKTAMEAAKTFKADTESMLDKRMGEIAAAEAALEKRSGAFQARVDAFESSWQTARKAMIEVNE